MYEIKIESDKFFRKPGTRDIQTPQDLPGRRVEDTWHVHQQLEVRYHSKTPKQGRRTMTPYFNFHHVVGSTEIDELNHAGNYHYIKWMQHAAIAHSATNGWPPEKYEALGAGWVVRSHNIVYLKPAFEGETITIKTWVSNMRPATSLRRYEIKNNAGITLAKAETDWAFMHYEKQKATRIPVEVSNCFVIVED